MPAPVNVKLAYPTVFIADWTQKSAQWTALNKQVGGNPDFYPLTIKAAYVIGIIHDLCESVTCLLRHPEVRQTTYIPAYGVFASGIDLLGRCIRGHSTTSDNTEDIRTGFKWLDPSPGAATDPVLITTNICAYTVNNLTAMRHFAAHGQATSRFVNLDYEILSMVQPLLANGLDRYWRELLTSECLCDQLAKATVLAFRSAPILKSWILFEKNEFGEYESVEQIFSKFDWHV